MINNLDTKPTAITSWKGYTLDELRYRITVNNARKEIGKERLRNSFIGILQGNISNVTGGDILKRMIGALNIMDYVVLAVKLGRTVRRIHNRYKQKDN